MHVIINKLLSYKPNNLSSFEKCKSYTLTQLIKENNVNNLTKYMSERARMNLLR